jgi:SPP1 gp7 family putative phage head morphogenesis protein
MVKWFSKKKKVAKEDPTWVLQSVALADPSLVMGGINIYNPSILVTRKGLSVFDDMLRDDMVKASTAFIKHSILSTGWELDGGDSKIVDVINDMFNNMDGTFYDALLGVLTSHSYGYSVSEKIYEEKNGLLWFTKLKSLAPHYIDFGLDKKGNTNKVIQYQDDLYGEYVNIPIPKVIIHLNDPKFGNPYGSAALEEAYRPWLIKDNTYKWFAMALERRGIPALLALYDPNKYKGSVLSDLKKAMVNIQAATVGTIPKHTDGIEFWEPKSAVDSKDVFEAGIKLFNRDISRSLLVPSMIGFGDEDDVGSMARSEVHFRSYMMIIEHMRDRLADVIQEQLVTQIVDLNFGPNADLPVFKFIPHTDESRIKIMETWSTMAKDGVVVPTEEDEEHIRALFEMPESGGTPIKQAPKGQEPEEPPEEPETPPSEDKASNKTVKATFAAKDNSKAVEARLDKIEQQSKDGLMPALEIVRDNLVKSYNEDMTPADIKNLQLKGMGPVQDGVMEMLRVGFQMGGTDALSEMGQDQKKFEFSPFTPTGALAYLSSKKFWITGLLKEDILKDAKAILYNAVKTGELAGETQGKLKSLFEKYLGSDTLPEHVTPYRLETIIRTNTTDAYNYGRLVEFKKHPHLLAGVRYSAILDTRTTPQCRLLDGKVFKLDDPALAKFTPPLHFNCRSLLVPVTIGTKLDPGDMVTPSMIGKANDLVPPEFGGA